jgi:alpha-beta hydrolase superfamily lysophospholipase
MESEPVVAEVDGVALAGSCWMPSSPRAAVLMLPGSGPSTRDNDVYFPAIREHLLAAGFGVASFDKRGVGESTGSLLDTSIDRQADDALACLTTLAHAARLVHLVGAVVDPRRPLVAVPVLTRVEPAPCRR